MYRNRALATCAVVWLAAVAAATAQDQLPSFQPADEAATAAAISGQPVHYEVAAGSGRADLAATTTCSETRPRKIDVTLAWETLGAGADQFRVDLTEFGRGFANGNYLTSGVLPSVEREIRFDAAEPGLFYYWRLLVGGADGWTLAANGRFEAPICPFDEVAK